MINHSCGKLKEMIGERPGVVTIRHDAKTQSGNSGSPLLDEGLSEVVGLHHSGENKGQYSFQSMYCYIS